MVPTPRCSCRWAALCVFVLLSCMAQATVYTWNLDAAHFNNGTPNGSQHMGSYTTSEGIKWDFTRTRKEGDIDLAHIAKSGDYVQFGGGSDNQGESLELTTRSIPNKIVRIEVECYSEVANGHSLSITVNSQSYEIQSDDSGNGSSPGLTAQGEAYVTTHLPLNQLEEGKITIIFNRISSDAYLYVKSVRIYTDELLLSHVQGRWGKPLLGNGMQEVHTEKRIIYAPANANIRLGRNNDAFQTYVRWYDYDTDKAAAGLTYYANVTTANPQQPDYSYNSCGAISTNQSGSLVSGLCAMYHYSDNEVVRIACDQSAYTDYSIDLDDNKATTTITEPTLSQRIIYEIHPALEMAEAVSACTTNSGKWLEEYTLFAPPKHSILVGPKYAYTNANGVIPNYYCKQGDNVLALKDGTWTWKENGAQPSRPIYNGQFYYYNDYQTDNDITFELTCTLNNTTYQIARFNVVRTNIQYPTQNRDSACLQNYRMLYCETFNYDSPGSGTHRYSKPLDAKQSELGFFTDNTNHIATNFNNNVQSSTFNQGVCEYALVNDGSWWNNDGVLQTNNYHNFANRDGLKDDGYSGVNGSKGYALNFKENGKQIKVYSLDIPNVYSSSDSIFVSAYLAAPQQNDPKPQLDFEIVGVMADESEIPIATYMTGDLSDMWGWHRVLFGFKANDQAGIHHYQLRIVFKGIRVSPSCFFLDDIAVYVPKDADNSAYAVQVVKDYDEPALPDVVAARPRRVRVPFSPSSGARKNEVEVKVKLSHTNVNFHFRDVTFLSATDAQYLEKSAANPLVCKPNKSDNNLLTGTNQTLVFSGFGFMKAGHSYTFRLRFYLDPDVQISSECLDNTGRVPDIESQITFIIVPDSLTFKTADAPGKKTPEYQSWQTAAWNNDANWLFITEDAAASAFAPCASTSVVFRSGDHILKDIVSATELELGSQDYIAYDIGFDPYTCRRVHVPAHTAIVGQENIRSTDAWSFDMPIVGGQWNMTAMPLKGIRTGDMFLTSGSKGDESDLAPFTAQSISQEVGQPASDRLVYSFYNSLYSEAGLTQVVAEGDPIDIARADWSLATNALTMSLDGKAWSLGLAAEGNHVMRLPKVRPVEYHYFQQGYWVEKADTIAADADYGKPLYTTSPHTFTLSNGFDGDIFIFGNPTFAYIDLVKFYAANSDKISNEFYLSGVGNTNRYNHYTATVNKDYTWTSTEYDAPLSRYLPPMTAVMIKRDPSDSKNHSLEDLQLTADMLVTSEGRGKTPISANAMPAHDELSQSRDALQHAISIRAQTADAGFISYALLVED